MGGTWDILRNRANRPSNTPKQGGGGTTHLSPAPKFRRGGVPTTMSDISIYLDRGDDYKISVAIEALTLFERDVLG